MTDSNYKNQMELATIIETYSGQDGAHATAIPSLFFLRRSQVTELTHSIYKPRICIIVQGAKEVFLAQERFRYGPSDYLVVSVDLPVSGQVTEASPEVPYLALHLEFTPSQILEVINDFKIQVGKNENAKRGMFVCPIESPMLDALIRLARLLDNPNDIPALAPLYIWLPFLGVYLILHCYILHQLQVHPFGVPVALSSQTDPLNYLNP